MRSFKEVYHELVHVQVKLLTSYSQLLRSLVDADPSQFNSVTPEMTQVTADMHRVLLEILADHKDQIFANRERLSKIISVIGIIGQVNDDVIKIFNEFKL